MENSKDLHVLWTNDDVNTSNLMVLMYATNGMLYQLWDSVTVIVWGATAKLVAENELIQGQIKVAQNANVKFSACIACARQFGVVEKLEELGIEVIPWVEPFTEIVQSGKPFISI